VQSTAFSHGGGFSLDTSVHLDDLLTDDDLEGWYLEPGPSGYRGGGNLRLLGLLSPIAG